MGLQGGRPFRLRSARTGGILNEPIERPAEGLWSSLRRRKVMQWGIAYVAAAWGLLQGLAYLSTVAHRARRKHVTRCEVRRSIP